MFTEKQRRVVAIHDISGFGKCSLTVALPVISAAGIETSVIPTAVLSTHTGGITGYTYRDLTDDIPGIARHWKLLGLTFDAIYSGYLGSEKQIDIVAKFIDDFKTDKNFALVDPAMADNGKMYAMFDTSFAAKMLHLCCKADIIVPNMTEALMMLGISYRTGPYSKTFIEEILKKLAVLGPEMVVLTGVHFDDKSIGAACYSKADGNINYVLSEKIEGMYHGTGDVFASALTAALVRGCNLKQSVQIAVDFTVGSIRRTADGGTDHLFGVDFERGIPDFIASLNETN